MLSLPDAWIWDFWIADTGTEYHLFFLRASRALLDPDRRHEHASVGHAVSTDLRKWQLLADALVPADGAAFDDMAIWTGCTVRAVTGEWFMFYTGVSHAECGRIQRIGLARSPDLVVWDRVSRSPIVESDSRYYEPAGQSLWPDEQWRDPWVFPDPDGDGWHMLLTARAREGSRWDRGVVGHAWSANLHTWEVCPPLSRPDAGFQEIEVTQAVVVEDRPVLIFSCLRERMSPARRAEFSHAGTWSLAAASVRGPFKTAEATVLTDRSLYAGRLVQDRTGDWVLLAFRNENECGQFVSGLSDPLPVGWSTDGHMELR